MVTQSGQAKIFYPSEYQSIPMDAADDEPSAPSKSLASVLENQCLTFQELSEIYDDKERNK